MMDDFMNTFPDAAQEGLLGEMLLPPPLPRNYIALSPAEPLLTSYDTYWGLVARPRRAAGQGETPGYLVYDATSVVIFYTAEELLTSYDQISRFLPALLPYCAHHCGELVSVPRRHNERMPRRPDTSFSRGVAPISRRRASTMERNLLTAQEPDTSVFPPMPCAASAGRGGDIPRRPVCLAAPAPDRYPGGIQNRLTLLLAQEDFASLSRPGPALADTPFRIVEQSGKLVLVRRGAIVEASSVMLDSEGDTGEEELCLEYLFARSSPSEHTEIGDLQAPTEYLFLCCPSRQALLVADAVERLATCPVRVEYGQTTRLAEDFVFVIVSGDALPLLARLQAEISIPDFVICRGQRQQKGGSCQ